MNTEEKETNPPNPGSPEAVERGCTCPALDNARGIGYHGVPGQWAITGGCPLHDPGYKALNDSVGAVDPEAC